MKIWGFSFDVGNERKGKFGLQNSKGKVGKIELGQVIFKV